MKAVMRQLAQARRHYSTLPLFDFLRDESLGRRARWSLVPGLAAALDAHARLEAERPQDPERALRGFIVDVAVPWPLLAVRLAQIAYPASRVQTRVVVESLEKIGHVLADVAVPLATRLGAIPACAAATVPRDAAPLLDLVLDARDRADCLDVAFRTFDLFADWSNEVHLEARHSLARRLLPAGAAAHVAQYGANRSAHPS